VANMRANGINPQQSKSGRYDDFSHAFYASLERPNGQSYADIRSGGRGGEVISAEVRVSELGLVVDVRDGGPHRKAWDDFMDRRPAAYPPEAAQLPMSTREFYTERKGWHPSDPDRGAAFEAFLMEQGLSHADAVIGPLGKHAMTRGIGEGNQIAIRSRHAANVLNERMGYPLIPEEDPVIPGAAKEAKPKTQPRRHLTRAEVEALPGDVAPEQPATEFQPDKAPSAKERAALARKASRDEANVENKLIERFQRTNKTDGPVLRDLRKALSDDVVLRAIRGTGADTAGREALSEHGAERLTAFQAGREGPEPFDPRESHLDEAKQAGASQKQVRALRRLLMTQEERLAVYREKLVAGEVKVEELETLRANQKNKSTRLPRDAFKVREAAIIADAIDAERVAIAASPGVCDVIAYVRELAVPTPGLDRLDVEAAEAVRRSVDQRALGRVRNRKANTPSRVALQQLDAAVEASNAFPALLDDLLGRASTDMRRNRGLLAEWRRARSEAGVPARQLGREERALRAVLQGGEAQTELAKGRQAESARKVRPLSLESMVKGNPELERLARVDRAVLLDRYAHLMSYPEAAKRTPEKLVELVRTYMETDAKAIVGEAAAVWDLTHQLTGPEHLSVSPSGEPRNITERFDARVLHAPSMTTGRANQRGIDSALVVPVPPKSGRYPRTLAERAAARVRLLFTDNKAMGQRVLSEVTALTQHLFRNIAVIAADHRAQITAMTAEGERPDAYHEAAVRQMEALLDDPALRKLQASIKGEGKTGYQSRAYAKGVAALLKKHGVELMVTRELGGIVGLSDLLKDYAFQLYDPPVNRPGRGP